MHNLIAAVRRRAAAQDGFTMVVAMTALVTVMLQGRSGGADAAPIAGRILEAAWRERW